ncbi:hypothetical protein ACS3SW_07045 [Roseobacteraceae bacterium S113]
MAHKVRLTHRLSRLLDALGAPSATMTPVADQAEAEAIVAQLQTIVAAARTGAHNLPPSLIVREHNGTALRLYVRPNSLAFLRIKTVDATTWEIDLDRDNS